MIFVLFLITALFGCFGMPREESSSYNMNSFFLGGKVQVIEYQPDGNAVQNGLVGQWVSNNVEQNSYSRILFDESKKFQETVYSELNGDKLASYQGWYKITANRLLITLDNGDQFQFSYHFVENRLRMSPIAQPDEIINLTN